MGYITALVFVLDHLIAKQIENADPEAEFPAAETLLKTLGMLHFLLLACALWAISGPGALSVVERAHHEAEQRADRDPLTQLFNRGGPKCIAGSQQDG